LADKGAHKTQAMKSIRCIIDVMNVQIKMEKRYKRKKRKTNLKKRLKTFDKNADICHESNYILSSHTESYVGCQILTRILMSASK